MGVVCLGGFEEDRGVAVVVADVRVALIGRALSPSPLESSFVLSLRAVSVGGCVGSRPACPFSPTLPAELWSLAVSRRGGLVCYTPYYIMRGDEVGISLLSATGVLLEDARVVEEALVFRLSAEGGYELVAVGYNRFASGVDVFFKGMRVFVAGFFRRRTDGILELRLHHLELLAPVDPEGRCPGCGEVSWHPVCSKRRRRGGKR